jgi:predicted RNA-binding protein (virulence factor B family)
MLGEYAYCEVVSTAPFGAFVDWGLPKDLFIPFAHQKNRLKVGDKVVLQVQSDPKTQRLIGSTKFDYISSKRPTNLKKNNQLDLLVYAKTPMGFKVIANNLYDGMIFHNEIFESVSIGDKKVGFVKNVRKDGKLDISLRPIGKKSADDQKILELLQSAGGFLPYNYKSDPQALIDTFGMSKKAFKKGLTTLLESGKITVLDNGIALHK